MNAAPRTQAPAVVTGVPSVPEQLAAIDLGSNSFHLVIGRVVDGHLDVVDRLREPVRLAAGLDDDKRLRRDSIERALACLRRFGQRLRGMPDHAVRAVGTNTLRSARNGEAFRREAERVLGHSIEVIAGREEARLIYLGVAHALASDGERRLGPFRRQVHLRADYDVADRVAAERSRGVRKIRQHAADRRLIRTKERPHVPVDAGQEGHRAEDLHAIPEAERERPGQRLDRGESLLPIEGRKVAAAGDQARPDDLGGRYEPQPGVAEERYAGRPRVAFLRDRRTRPREDDRGQHQDPEPYIVL